MGPRTIDGARVLSHPDYPAGLAEGRPRYPKLRVCCGGKGMAPELANSHGVIQGPTNWASVHANCMKNEYADPEACKCLNQTADDMRRLIFRWPPGLAPVGSDRRA